jgi:hypothetical protein
MENEDLKRMEDEDIRETLKYISDVMLELMAWKDKSSRLFSIVTSRGEICVQGVYTNYPYKCIDGDNANKPFSQIMDDFFNSKDVLNEGLSVALENLASLIRKQ